MRLDLLAAPAQQAAGRRLGLAGFRILQQIAQPTSGQATLQADGSTPLATNRPEDQPPEHEPPADPDATELLMQDEQQRAPGSHADQRAQHRLHRNESYQREQTSFRTELRAAHHAGRTPTGTGTPASNTATTSTASDASTGTAGGTTEETPAAAKQPAAASQPRPPAADPTQRHADAARSPTPQPTAPRDLTTAESGVKPTASATPLPKDASVQRTSAPRPPALSPAPAVAPTLQPKHARGPQRPPAQADAPRPTDVRETTTTSDKAVTATAGAPRDQQHDSGSDARQSQQHFSLKTSAAPAAVQPQQPTEPLDPADRAQNLERIVRVVQAEALSGNSRVVLQLSPPELGNLRMQLNLRRGQLDVQVRAETELARGLLTGGADSLRSGLQQAGLELVNFDVQPAAPPTGTPAGQALRPVPALPDRRAASEGASPGDTTENRDPVAEPRLNVLA